MWKLKLDGNIRLLSPVAGVEMVWDSYCYGRWTMEDMELAMHLKLLHIDH